VLDLNATTLDIDWRLVTDCRLVVTAAVLDLNATTLDID